MDTVSEKLRNYVENEIFPMYKHFFAHGLLHICRVVEHSLIIAKDYDVNINMVYCIACYHDLGLINVCMNRSDHALESGKLLENDKNLEKFFSQDEIKIMKEAVEDHQGSRNEKPRNIYGMIVSDADRDIDISILAKRQLATSIKYYPELVSFDEHFERCYNYILNRNKIQFNLWTDNKIIEKKMFNFKKHFLDKDYTKKIYKQAWDYIEKNNLKEKILNYYDD